MPNSFPTYELVKLNIALSLTMAIMACTYIIISTGRADVDILFRFFELLIFTIMISMGNMGLYIYRQGYKHREQLWHKVAFYTASYACTVIAGLLVRYLYSLITHKEWEGHANPGKSYSLAIISVFIINTLILMIQRLSIVQYRRAKGEIENMALKATLADASNILLRQQIQPHFLFNALATVKSLYKQDMAKGEEYLIHLSNFLRASLNNNKSAQIVPVKEELDFCMNYMEMQQIRFGNSIIYSIGISDATLKNKYLPYFSLQPLIENALKHNDFTEEYPLSISISEADDHILVQNNVQSRKHTVESTGNGLYNLSERYKLLGVEGICIISEEKLFKVRLKLLDK